MLIALDIEGEVFACGGVSVGLETPLSDVSAGSLQVQDICKVNRIYCVDVVCRGCCSSSWM